MTIGHELAISGEPFEWLLLPMRVVAIDVVEDPRLKHEECSVDPSFFGLWLFRELDDLISHHLQVSETSGGPNCRERCQLSVSTMKRQQFMDI